MSIGLTVVHILVVAIPAALVTWLLGVHLPRLDAGRGDKILVGGFLSFVAFALSALILFLTGGGAVHAIPTSARYIEVYGFGLCAFPFVLTVPFLAGADALLYFGGRAAALHRSLSWTLPGYVGAGLGALLWIGTVLAQVSMAALMMEM